MMYAPALHISLAGSLWHPCPDCAERLSLCSGHPDGQGPNFQTLWLFESDFDEYIDVSQPKLSTASGPFRRVSLLAPLCFLHRSSQLPHLQDVFFCLLGGPLCFAGKQVPGARQIPVVWQGLLSPSQKPHSSIIIISPARFIWTWQQRLHREFDKCRSFASRSDMLSVVSPYRKASLGKNLIDSLTSFILKSGCTLQELCVAGQITAISAASYRQAFPAISRFSFPEQL